MRARRYLLPQLKHFIVFAVLSGIAMLLELASTLVFFDLLTNKVFLGDPLTRGIICVTTKRPRTPIPHHLGAFPVLDFPSP